MTAKKTTKRRLHESICKIMWNDKSECAVFLRGDAEAIYHFRLWIDTAIIGYASTHGFFRMNPSQQQKQNAALKRRANRANKHA